MTVDFAGEALAMQEDLVRLRREIHRDPEIGLQLPRTKDRILKALDGLPLEIHTGESLDFVIAVLRGEHAGPTVLLRGDMDALPVAEATGLDYASENGAMHACGHDLHVTGLVGAVRLLAAHRAELHGTVAFMFQPGEEGDGGARIMLEEGMWETIGGKPDAAYGIHVIPGERGIFETRPGVIMAGANTVEVTFNGRGGHSSMPESSANPNIPCAEFAVALQNAVASSFSVFDPVVATVTRMRAGEAINVIPPSASVGASVRTLSADSTKRFPEVVRRLADRVAAAHDCTAQVVWTEQYPVTVNDGAETASSLDVLNTMFGAERVIAADNPKMGSEDFSYVLAEVPGTFIFLFASPDGVDLETAATNHSPLVLFDDAVLADQAAALAGLAWARLARH